MFFELQGSDQELLSRLSNVVFIGSANPPHQAVYSQALENAPDLASILVGKDALQCAIGQSADMMLSAQDS